MNAPLNPKIADWLHRLGECEPESPTAQAVYAEAARAGLVDELEAALLAVAAAFNTEAALLAASRRGRPQ